MAHQNKKEGMIIQKTKTKYHHGDQIGKKWRSESK
jgi:hypothetical protein